MLKNGSKLLVCHRPLFAGDWPRLFVGEVSAYENGFIRLTGYSFTKDPDTGLFDRIADPRTKLVSLASGAFLVYELPFSVDIDSADIEERSGDRMMLIDRHGFEMDLSIRA
jgi:hypothetical protein